MTSLLIVKQGSIVSHVWFCDDCPAPTGAKEVATIPSGSHRCNGCGRTIK